MNKISTLLEASASTPNSPSQPQTTRASPIAEVDPTHIRNPSPNTTSIPPERIINVLSPLVEVPAPPLKPPSAHQTAAKPSSAEVAAAPSGSSSSTTATQPKTTATSSTRAPTEALPQVPFTSFASVIAALRAGTLSSSLFEAELDELVKERVARIVTALTRIDKEDDRRRFILTQLAQTIPTIGSADETKDVLFAWRRWYELARLSFELDSDENDGPAIGAPRWMDNYCWQAFNIALRNSCNVDFHAFAEIAKFRNFVDVLRFAGEFDHPRKTPPPPRILSAITKMAAEHSWEGTPDADDYGSITACFLYGQKVVDIVTEDTSGIVWASTEQACLKLAWEAVPADWQALVLKQGDPKSFLDSSDLFADAFNAVTWDMEVKERLRQEEIRLRGRKTFKLSDPDFDEIFGKEGLVLDCERAAVEMGFLAKRW
ncbi:hypothetical protein BCR35DRAFT_306976 [Leucosporidium creatinivorum]|uniref:Uncharacterized protein n=1 Tax=Leucosporidium creatinivorum TaxID=106004 RepID=A0A1Y2EQR0_9BASI|nr:hypothetical protein BCR35DRAFT_306976 [Leucosporidium creatinivorum]